jgi:uncharacterized protein
MTPFDLRTLRLRPGEERTVEREVKLLGLELGGQAYRPVPETVTAELRILQATSGQVLELRFLTHLIGPCMRCLAAAALDLRISAREYQDAVPGGRGDELSTIYVDNDLLDLGQWAHDEVALALPEQILCRVDCAGICPTCGKDLNVEPHEHEQQSADPRWQALAEIRDRLV